MFSFGVDVGSLFSDDEKKARAQSERQRWEERAWFKSDRAHAERFAARELQRRVVDAKRAGLHPLAALGVNPSSGVAFQHTSSPSYSRESSRPGVTASYVPEDKSAQAVNEAQARKLNTETDLMLKQAVDSDLARMKQARTPELVVNTRLPGVDLPATDPKFSAADDEEKYGEISDIDGALMRFLDNLRLTRDALKFFNQEYIWKGFNEAKKHPYTKDDPVFHTYE